MVAKLAVLAEVEAIVRIGLHVLRHLLIGRPAGASASRNVAVALGLRLRVSRTTPALHGGDVGSIQVARIGVASLGQAESIVGSER